MSTFYEQGAYRGEIVDQGLSQSSNGNPQIWLKFTVKESIDHPTETIQSYDRLIYWTITEKTVGFILDKLAALGFDGESWRQIDLNHINTQSFVGQLEDFYCKLETYEGVEREKWDLSYEGSAIKPLDDGQARQLDALFGKKLKERFKVPSKPREKPKNTPEEQTAKENGAELETALAANDDNIPF